MNFRALARIECLGRGPESPGVMNGNLSCIGVLQVPNRRSPTATADPLSS
jgi:hypothetical protein